MANTFHRQDLARGRVFVKRVAPCRAFDMYGYAVGWTCFLKIQLFNPMHVYKCAELMLSGQVTGESLQPYESHIPFLLSFLADYDLYGCGWLYLDEAQLSERPQAKLTIHSGREFDAFATGILNRQNYENDQRHTQVFETQSNKVSISSLQEARETDARWREKMGLRPWQPQNLQPYYQDVSHNWQWERSQEFKELLKKHIKENREAKDEEPLDLGFLPTAAELVPSAPGSAPGSIPSEQADGSTSANRREIPGENSGVDNGVESRTENPEQGDGGEDADGDEDLDRDADDEVIYSESDDEDLSLLLAMQRAHPENGGRDGRSSGSALDVPADIDSVRDVNTAAKEASTVLSSQFSSQCGSKAAAKAVQAFGLKTNDVLQFRYESPLTSDVLGTSGVTEHTRPFYSDADDVVSFPFRYGGKEFKLKTRDPTALVPFDIAPDPSFPRLREYYEPRQLKDAKSEVSETKKRRLELMQPAPSTSEVREWATEEERKLAQSVSSASGKYQFASLGMRDSLDEEMSTCAIEIHANTRPGKVPKANTDAIHAVFWQVSGVRDEATTHGVITTMPLDASETASVTLVDTESQLLEEVTKMVRYFNPDILTGYELNAGSWGYARVRYEQLHPEHSDLFFEELGRVRPPKVPPWKAFAAGLGASAPASAGPSSGDEEKVKGRHLLSLWNIVRKEVALSKYTLEHVVCHVFHEPTPRFDYDDLNAWWTSGDPTAVALVVRYWTGRVAHVLRLLSHFEIVNRTCAQSRITGVDFLSSLTRGSQFQVEAVMCRLSRRQNFVLISPSKTQVGQQNALEYIPLVMEPRSDLYTDPVCVLDFRSLYPSVVIAFNLCYSTCIGRMDLWRGLNKLGVKQHHALQRGILAQIGEDNIYVAPNGMGYVNPKVRKSLLAQMLGEILETRFMTNETRKVKSLGPDNARLLHNLNNKQLALKFIANVTYGYTSASFSGRMPCAELADSIVLTGREILQWSIRKIEAVQKWGVQAETVYGDTDSLFVRLPGVSREQAFRIGTEIADMITAETPDPILLKLEKVYDPCILLTKKRYVGHAYETAAQPDPIFDAKGTETVRRDGTPIVQKIERRALQILFNSRDLSKVKQYLQNQWRSILRGHKLNVQDFSFAQEVKLGHYKTAHGTSNLPGGAVVSMRKMMKDDGLEPQYRERVPFVVAAGPAGSRINDRVVSPEEMVKSPSLVLDAEYYIQKVIVPPLERLLNLVGANVRDWYAKMPRPMRVPKPALTGSGWNAGGRTPGTLYGFLQSEMCVVCLEKRRESSSGVLCAECRANAPRSRYIMTSRTQREEQKLAHACASCRLCSGAVPPITIGLGYRTHPCESIDCPVFYEREGAYNEFSWAAELSSLI